MKRLRRNLEDPESRAFWEAIDAAAAEVNKWPEWKRLLIAGERPWRSPDED